MLETGIFIQKVFYPWSELNTYTGEEPVLQFCHDWLGGMDVFTLFSSGSTGKPKEIQIRRAQMLCSAAATQKVLHVMASDQMLLGLNPKTIGGTMTLVRAMVWNLNLHVVPAEGNPFRHLEKNHPCTLCSLVPLQLFDILQDPESIAKLKRFQIVLLGGSAIDDTLFLAIQKLQPRVYHTYGMTETCSHIALRQLNGPDKQKRFYPLEGVRVALSEEETLLIETPMAISSPLKTNDLAKIFPDSSFEILGRLDRTLISGGIKLHLDELERLFSSVLTGFSFFLYGMEDVRLGQKMVLVLESEPFHTGELEKKLEEIAPEFKAPKAIIFAPRFERTTSGKTDRITTFLKWAKTS